MTLQVGEGDKVTAGQTVATIEAMKMEASITAHAAGTVGRLAIGAVQQVEGGDLPRSSWSGGRATARVRTVRERVTRIVAGVAGGRRLAVPPRAPGPTSDRVREALFAALEHDPGLDGAAVLDLCAGSGCARAGGAVARGGARAVRGVRPACGRGAAAQRRRASGCPARWCGRRRRRPCWPGPPDRAYDLVLVDPPYEVPDAEVAGWLAAAAAHGWLADGAVVVVERPARGRPFPWPPPLRPSA